MSSVRGFRCQWCRAEVLAAAEVPGMGGQADRASPVLCCGAPLRPLSQDQILSEILVGVLARGRVARCPRCGYRIRVVVHPSGSLVCRSCQTNFTIGTGETSTRDRLGLRAVKESPGSFRNG